METTNQIIEGTIEKIFYYSNDTNFTAGMIKTKEKNAVNIKFVGTLFEPREGDELKAQGCFEKNNYGEQFKIETYETILPQTKDGIIEYLASSYVKGIGKVTAKKIVDAFGENALEIINEDYTKLTQIKGISQKKAEIIHQCLANHKEIQNLIIFLKECEVTPKFAPKIVSYFKESPLSKIKNNPYELTKIKGIGFKIADKVGIKLGFDKTNINRIENGLLFVLESQNTGDMFCFWQDILNLASEILEVESKYIEDGISNLLQKKQIIKEDNYLENPNNPAIYLKYNYVYENGLNNLFYERQFKLKNEHIFYAENDIKELEKQKNMKLSEQQKRAIIFACKEKELIISGCPGTGKSTITQFIYQIFRKYNKNVVLTAPTGRASKRMTEIIGAEASTIHRLLEYSPEERQFTRNENNPLEGDIFIVDEVSMVGCGLMYKFLKAVPKEANIILIGDVYQLPSVEPGNILKDLMESKRIHVEMLDKIFRQAEKSKIIVNSHKIKNQEKFHLPAPKEEPDKDFWFLKREDPECILKAIKTLYTRTFANKNPKINCQILTPMKKGLLGTENLNNEIQQILNPVNYKTGIKKGRMVFGLGDKVMQLKNDYDNQIFNGDIGYILDINKEDEELTVSFSENLVVTLDFSALENLTLAYAITIHKSQGSEFKYVIMPVSTQHYIMLANNLIYTGITRAKEKLVLIGQEKAFWMAVNNNKITQRNTLLTERLQESKIFQSPRPSLN